MKFIISGKQGRNEGDVRENDFSDYFVEPQLKTESVVSIVASKCNRFNTARDIQGIIEGF